jgi:hypothetical protein
MKFNPTNTKVPCFNCSNRSIACHAECERYKAYRNEKDAVNADVYRQRMLRNELDNYSIAIHTKRKRHAGF